MSTNERRSAPERDTEKDLDRRSLLRQGTALLGGVAALTAAGAATAPGASAVPGDPVDQGEPNDAGTASTGLTSTSDATLVVANGATGAALRVGVADAALDPFDFESPTGYPATTTSGDLVNYGGALVFSHDTNFVGEVYTDVWANQLVPISPQRVVDTRNTAGRSRILNKAGNLDAQGRLIGGKSIEIDLRDYVFVGLAGFFNLTIVAPSAGGHATLFPALPVPSASSINYSSGVTIANGLVCGLNPDADTVRVFSARTTHLILDVSAFWVGTPEQVNPELLARPEALARRGAAPARVAPSWAPARLANRR
jgi:hypothetical protein